MMNELVTAIIPLHNHERFVCDAVESVVENTYPNKRLIVVENGSKDNGPVKVLSMMNKENRQAKNSGNVLQVLGERKGVSLMLVKIPNGIGPSSARNVGIKIGWDETKYFAFLDSDDIYHKEKIAKSVSKFTDEVAVVYSDYETLNDEGLRLVQFKEPYSKNRLLQECIVNCDSLISKKAFEKCGLFDESLRVCEDYDRWLNFSEHFLLYHIPENLVTIRVGNHSSSSQVNKQLWEESYKKVFGKMRKRLST